MRFYIAYGVIVITVYILLMIVAFPWWHATNHPVSLTFGVDDSTEINLGYSTREKPLRVVPTGERVPFHWKWATELPPRPGYDLYLEFPKGTGGEAILKEITVLNFSAKNPKVSLDLTGLEERSGKSVRIRKLGDAWGITAQQGARINLPGDFHKLPVSRWFKDWIVATWGFLLVAGGGLLVLATALRFPNGIEPRKRLVPVFETAILLIGFLAGAAAHMHLLKHAIPVYSLGDSTAYLMDALVGNPGFSAAPDSLLYFVNPLPVYTLFLRSSLNALNGDLNALILIQGGLYCMATGLLALSFRRLVHGYLAGPVVFLVLLSPAAVWTSRQIHHVSLFATCWILGIAAFIFLWQRAGTLRLAGWLLFGLAATLAVCIHPSGFLLLVLPSFMLIGALWWSYSNRGARFWKIPVLWATVGQAAIPFSLVLGVFFSISWMNSLDSSAGSINGYSEIQRSHAPFVAGNFDVTVAGTDQEYADLIRARARARYAFNGWDLRKVFLNSMKGQGEMNPHDLIDQLNFKQYEFNNSIQEKLPLRARLAAMGRVSSWAISSPGLNSYSLEPISPSYKVISSFSEVENEDALRRNLTYVASGTDLPLKMTKAISDPWVVLYNKSIVALYPWIYRILFLLSLVALVFAVSERKYLASAAISPFLFFVLYHVYQVHVLGDELQGLDALLWLGVLMGLTAVSRNTLQTETAEDDRRCLPPVKPKRLLARHAHKQDILL